MTRELLREVTVSASSAKGVPAVTDVRLTPIDELIQGMERSPMTYEEAVATAPDVFESDEELDEFLIWYRTERQRHDD